MKRKTNDTNVSTRWTFQNGTPFPSGWRSISCIHPRARRCEALPTGPPSLRAFTLIELIVVMVLLAIGAAMAVPMFSLTSSAQVRSAANMIAADLEYAKSMAISRGQKHAVVFNATGETYQLQDQTGTVLTHPVKRGFNYVVDFSMDSRLDQVDLSSVSFDTTSTVKFDPLGSPFNGDDNPLNSGSVEVSVGFVSRTISVEPVTGIISVN